MPQLAKDPIKPDDFINFLSSLGVSLDSLPLGNKKGEDKKPTEEKSQESTPDPTEAIKSLLLNSVDGTPGKGMDDDVPATIEGNQPAALSEGEFVWPADVVSLLGDGNTQAGAEVLKNLMDQIRQMKTGQKEQPQEMSKLLSKGK